MFQIEFANLARIKNNKIHNNTKANETIKNTFFGEGNFNNRFGGTLNLVHGQKSFLSESVFSIKPEVMYIILF